MAAFADVRYVSRQAHERALANLLLFARSHQYEKVDAEAAFQNDGTPKFRGAEKKSARADSLSPLHGAGPAVQFANWPTPYQGVALSSFSPESVGP